MHVLVAAASEYGATQEFAEAIGGHLPKPKEDPVAAAGLLEATGARGHRVFPGRIDRERLDFAEKAIVLALRAPDGDFRDWQATGAWAREIADDLR